MPGETVPRGNVRDDGYDELYLEQNSSVCEVWNIRDASSQFFEIMREPRRGTYKCKLVAGSVSPCHL